MNPASFRQLIGITASSASVQDSTLIIIDAQNEYAFGKLQVEGISESRAVISALLQKYRQGGDDTELALELEELTPRSGEKVITKAFPSSFAQTGLHDYLSTLGDFGKKIVLVGYMAHVCVSTTARAGHELGYDVIVVRDAVGDRDIPGVKAPVLTAVSLSALEDAFATVVSASDIGV
ncbi:hypothetical protein N7468_005862 [Penicillium chermesinum]|uniref:Isochorismatase-like domain-containing protein n=1 Tax=Penicillium chermesinum TaxID=63820 RepID=A0A9W9NZZ5_9EURO|nr:uncharacterized protein N7468_005862 [Penicillium chermesinum]KAJ5232906.1 hypothetical protein N7468_005862 [Penicillium chermesinum]